MRQGADQGPSQVLFHLLCSSINTLLNWTLILLTYLAGLLSFVWREIVRIVGPFA